MLTLTTDLFLTDCFLIKGNVENKYTRLSRMLDGHRNNFIKLRDATLIDLVSKDRIQTPLLHVNLDEVLVAHEFLDEARDDTAALLAREQDGDFQRVRVFYTGNLNVELAGRIRPRSYDLEDRTTHRFFVMREPKLRGFSHGDDQELKQLLELPYAILNKARLSYVYDFNG